MSIDSDVHAAPLPWMGDAANARRDQIIGALDLDDLRGADERVHALIDRNRQIHDRECINLNPASNTMNPRAEAVLAAGLTTRASLGKWIRDAVASASSPRAISIRSSSTRDVPVSTPRARRKVKVMAPPSRR